MANIKKYTLIYNTKSEAEEVNGLLLDIAKERGNDSEIYSPILENDSKFGVIVLEEDMNKLDSKYTANKEERKKGFNNTWNKKPE